MDVLAVGAAVSLAIAGVVLVLRAAVPRGQLGAPLTLMGIGVGVLALRLGVPPLPDLSHQAPAALIVGGVLVALFRRRPGIGVDTGVRRCTSVLYPPVRPRFTGTAPRKLIVRALLFGSVEIDLSGTEFPFQDSLVVDITVLWARVDLKVPSDWTVLAGRVELTSGVGFSGDLSAPVFASPGLQMEQKPLVVNVQGLGGIVSLARGNRTL
ncbi:hypothetical protein ACGF3G_06095 [Streptomyces sp. NPDC048179]|uniref:hypothetical protein n=1 Tax=Streptomyces sp. NPDC048179 TaxID=3365506 RepID=UPI00371D74ED